MKRQYVDLHGEGFNYGEFYTGLAACENVHEQLEILNFLTICVETKKSREQSLIFVVPCIMLYSGEISPTRCNNYVFYSQWNYSTCFG